MRKTKSYENQEGAYMKLVKKIVDVALIFVLMVSMVGCNTTTNTKENKKNTKLTIMTTSVSYTHLDVYKRQVPRSILNEYIFNS